MPRIAPLPLTNDPEVREALSIYNKTLGFIPNAALIMQHKPAFARAFASLVWSLAGTDCEVDVGFKRLLRHVSSSIHGCHY